MSVQTLLKALYAQRIVVRTVEEVDAIDQEIVRLTKQNVAERKAKGILVDAPKRKTSRKAAKRKRRK